MFEDMFSFYVEQGFVSELASNGIDSERVVEFDHDAYPYEGQVA
jgi:hypothetical protein